MESPAQDLKVEARQVVNTDEDHVQLAYAKLKMLRESLGEQVPTLQGVTLAKLRRSKQLRTLILEADILHFFANKAPKGSSFFKQDETPIDQYQRLQQSQMMRDMNEVHKAATHNYKEYE